MRLSYILTFILARCVITTLNSNQVVKTTNDPADAGNFISFPAPDLSIPSHLFLSARGNTAKSRRNVANAGNRLIFFENGTLNNSELDITETTRRNFAQSKGDSAIAGSQNIFWDVLNGTQINKASVNEGQNKAVVKGNGPVATSRPTAIAGDQTQIQTLDDSSFYSMARTSSNTAKNKLSGDAVGGVQNIFAHTTESFINLRNTAGSNSVKAKNGSAIGGTENTFVNLTDSTLNLWSVSRSNDAQASGVDNVAAAGVVNNFGSVIGSAINMYSGSTGGMAKASKGASSVSGVANNFESVKRSNVTMGVRSGWNEAITRDSINKDSKDAISGVKIGVDDLEDSNLYIFSCSRYNNAINFASDSGTNNDSDAVAGFQLVVGNSSNSLIWVEAESLNNFAKAKNGDAVAGNQIQIGNSDVYSHVKLYLEAANNIAESKNGNAIIDNDVSIGGDASLVSYP